MSEDELMENIRCLVTDLGLYAYHAADSRRSWGPGFPDLVIAGPNGILFREAKTDAGQLSRDQKLSGYRLAESGADWGVWRPGDLRPRTAGQPGPLHRQLLWLAGRGPVR